MQQPHVEDLIIPLNPFTPLTQSWDGWADFLAGPRARANIGFTLHTLQETPGVVVPPRKEGNSPS